MARFISNVRCAVVQCILLATIPALAWAQNACDLNKDLTVNVVDVQWATNMALGVVPCTAAINGAGVCNVVVVQRVVNAALGGACVVDGGSVPHSATLTWTASTSANVTGYNIYRRTTPTGSYTKVNSALILGTTYTDSAVIAGQTYYYVATAIDSSNNESGYSNEAQATIPSP